MGLVSAVFYVRYVLEERFTEYRRNHVTIENVKKNCSSSLKTQDFFLKDLENKNNGKNYFYL